MDADSPVNRTMEQMTGDGSIVGPMMATAASRSASRFRTLQQTASKPRSPITRSGVKITVKKDGTIRRRTSKDPRSEFYHSTQKPHHKARNLKRKAGVSATTMAFANIVAENPADNGYAMRQLFHRKRN